MHLVCTGDTGWGRDGQRKSVRVGEHLGGPGSRGETERRREGQTDRSSGSGWGRRPADEGRTEVGGRRTAGGLAVRRTWRTRRDPSQGRDPSKGKWEPQGPAMPPPPSVARTLLPPASGRGTTAPGPCQPPLAARPWEQTHCEAPSPVQGSGRKVCLFVFKENGLTPSALLDPGHIGPETTHAVLPSPRTLSETPTRLPERINDGLWVHGQREKAPAARRWEVWPARSSEGRLCVRTGWGGGGAGTEQRGPTSSPACPLPQHPRRGSTRTCRQSGQRRPRL